MAYYKEEEVGQLIEQYLRWPGWSGSSGGGSPLAWIDNYISKRPEQYESTVPVLGGLAADTHTALTRMDRVLREALIAYYDAPRLVDDKVRLLNLRKPKTQRITRRTFVGRVGDAHYIFIQEFESVVMSARRQANTNAKSQGVLSSGEFAVATEREKPQSSAVTISRPNPK